MSGAFRFDPQTRGIVWGKKSPLDITSDTAPVVEMITLTQANIDAKGVFLSSTPIYPSIVELTPEGGIPQLNGTDYEVIQGKFLSWDGLGLDNFLEVNEVLTIKYSTLK